MRVEHLMVRRRYLERMEHKAALFAELAEATSALAASMLPVGTRTDEYLAARGRVRDIVERAEDGA